MSVCWGHRVSRCLVEHPCGVFVCVWGRLTFKLTVWGHSQVLSHYIDGLIRSSEGLKRPKALSLQEEIPLCDCCLWALFLSQASASGLQTDSTLPVLLRPQLASSSYRSVWSDQPPYSGISVCSASLPVAFLWVLFLLKIYAGSFSKHIKEKLYLFCECYRT